MTLPTTVDLRLVRSELRIAETELAKAKLDMISIVTIASGAHGQLKTKFNILCDAHKKQNAARRAMQKVARLMGREGSPNDTLSEEVLSEPYGGEDCAMVACQSCGREFASAVDRSECATCYMETEL